MVGGEKNSAFLTEATWQDHTAIFHSHSSAFAHDSKGTQAPRKPSSKHCLPIFQTCHSLSVYQLVLHKGPPPSAVAFVVVIVPIRGKHVRRVSSISPHNASLSDHIVWRQTLQWEGQCGFLFFFSHQHFDSVQYPRSTFQWVLKNHMNARKYDLSK